tara:strand:+ start:1155 stop:1385 length:231 start_codon:yes stop_codon:yes gene_type:complete
MKRVMKKYQTFIFRKVFEKIVKFLQSSKVENEIAKKFAEKMPDKKGFGNKEQKALAVVAVDAMTDKIAQALGMSAD